MLILAINAGSSSIKLQLYRMPEERLLFHCLVERPGENDARLSWCNHAANDGLREETSGIAAPDHAAVLERLLTLLGQHGYDSDTLEAAGHRIVHGGGLRQAQIIDDDLISTIRAALPLAPLHNPAGLGGIETLRRLAPDLPQVALFDTAFFADLPACARRYPLPGRLCRQYHLRRYGFHGISHQYVATEAARHLRRPLQELRLISLHLGNGASIAAIRNGICIDTSMGMTPLDGLMMGTRCGDLDPSALLHLARSAGLGYDELETLLNRDSGLKGVCGESDMRQVEQRAASGDTAARLAIEMFCYRISKYIGAYYTALEGADALLFTAGIGENSAQIRMAACRSLHVLGIRIDEARNRQASSDSRDIGMRQNRCRVLVVPTNEGLAIARQVFALLS